MERPENQTDVPATQPQEATSSGDAACVKTKTSLLSRFGDAGKIVQGLTGVVVLVTGAVGLYYLLWPAPPIEQQASFASSELQQYGPPTTFQEYLELVGSP